LSQESLVWKPEQRNGGGEDIFAVEVLTASLQMRLLDPNPRVC
jgi:hypothetical protein